MATAGMGGTGGRGRGQGGPVQYKTAEEAPESPNGLVNVIPPFMRDWFGLPSAALKCCTSTRPPEDEPEKRSNMGTCGVGMILKDVANPTYNGYNVSVATLSAGGPADTSKQIQPGDILLRVDGRDVVGMKTQQLGDLLLGHVGSAVSLQMRRGPAWKGGEGKTYTVDLHRRWANAGLKELPDRS